MKNKKLKVDILNVLVMIFGTIIMGFAFNIFLIPNNISPSGFSGLSAIFSYMLSEINIVLSPSIIYLLLNIVLFIFAYKIVGKKYSIYAIIGILAFSASMEITSYIQIAVNEDLLVCALYGGIIMGIGTGLVLRSNGSTGGTDMLATIIRNKTTKLSTGQIMFISNIVVLVLSFFAYGASSLLYSIITISLSSEVCDIVIDGSRGVKAYYIITEKKNEVVESIYQNINRGVTEIKSTGTYSHQDKNMLLCLVNKYRAPLLKRIVTDVDPNAFIFSTNVTEVIGRGFYIPTKKTKKKAPALNHANIPASVATNESISDNLNNSENNNFNVLNIEKENVSIDINNNTTDTTKQA